MSQRSMLEFNHDHSPSNEEFDAWALALRRYLRSGDPKLLPYGVTFFRRRHHSEACPLGKPPRGWDNHEARLVPEEPTPRMIKAAEIKMYEHMAEPEDWTLENAKLGLIDAIASAPVFEPSDACVEKVARAICQADGFEPDAVSYNFERHARAAIEAFQKAVAEEPERAGRDANG